MTRRDVARCLGKSIATVRRAEGKYLHPRRDGRGMLHFDTNEVRRLRDAIERGDVRLSGEKFRRTIVPERMTKEETGHNLRAHVERLRREREELRLIGMATLELFLTACPDKCLNRQEVATLEAFEAALRKRLGD